MADSNKYIDMSAKEALKLEKINICFSQIFSGNMSGAWRILKNYLNR